MNLSLAKSMLRAQAKGSFFREIVMEPTQVNGYDRGWETEWDDMKKYGPFSRHIRQILGDMIRLWEFKSVLDVGCGLLNPSKGGDGMFVLAKAAHQ